MNLAEKTLKRLVNGPITLVDRSLIPHESVFSKPPPRYLSSTKRRAREIAIEKICRDNHPLNDRGKTSGSWINHFRYSWLPQYTLTPSAWVLLPKTPEKKEQDWTPHACAIGKRLFGADHELPQTPMPAINNAIIFPNSPSLKQGTYWEIFTGIPHIEHKKKTIDNLTILHEAGHFLFPFPWTEHNPFNAYLSEAFADAFAITSYRDLGGAKSDIKDYIAARRVSSFFNGSNPAYWTAAACEATLKKAPLPAYQQAFGIVRELQVRVLDELNGINRRHMDTADYQKACKHFVHAENNRQESIWTTPEAGFNKAFRKFAPPLVIETLAIVVEESCLCEKTRKEGLKTLKACKRFGPTLAPTI